MQWFVSPGVGLQFDQVTYVVVGHLILPMFDIPSL